MCANRAFELDRFYKLMHTWAQGLGRVYRYGGDPFWRGWVGEWIRLGLGPDVRKGEKISQDLSKDFHMGPKREKDL